MMDAAALKRAAEECHARGTVRAIDASGSTYDAYQYTSPGGAKVEIDAELADTVADPILFIAAEIAALLECERVFQ